MIGIISSFIGAALQATNYFVTQRAQTKNNYTAIQSLIATHLGMGIILLFPLLGLGFWRYFDFEDMPTILLTNVPYMIAQVFLFSAIKISDSSVVSPLLVLKIPALAIFGIVAYDQQIEIQQWLAIGIIVYLAYSISTLSGKIQVKPAAFVMMACMLYGMSDIGITRYTASLGDLPLYHRIFISVTINYVFCALVMLPLVGIFKVPLVAIKHTKWSAITWLSAVGFLVVGYTLSGVVQANVAQSTRGVIAVFIGFVALKMSNSVMKDARLWSKKMVISSLMIVGVAIFYI